MNYSGRYAPAGVASIIRSSGIVWSYLLEIILFHEVPQKVTLVGVGFIFLSLFIIAIDKIQQQSQTQQNQQQNPQPPQQFQTNVPTLLSKESTNTTIETTDSSEEQQQKEEETIRLLVVSTATNGTTEDSTNGGLQLRYGSNVM